MFLPCQLLERKGEKKQCFSALVLKGTTCPCLLSGASLVFTPAPPHGSSDLATCLTVTPSFIH